MNTHRTAEETTAAADAFEQQFRDAEQPRVRTDVTPQSVLASLGFRETSFEQLPAEWQDALRSYSRHGTGFRYGAPVEHDGRVNSNAFFMLHPDGTVLYTFRPISSCFSWARLERKDGSVQVRQMNHDSNITEVIRGVSFHEFTQREHPELYPTPDGETLPPLRESARVAAAKLLTPKDA